MPPTRLTWTWAWTWVVLTLLALLTTTLADKADLADTIHPLPDVGGVEDMCGGEAPPVTPPVVDVTWERNSSQVAVKCPPKLRSFFSTDPSEPPPAPTSPFSALAVVGAKGRGVVLNLTQLVQEGLGGQVVVDVEGCGCVNVAVGVPKWAVGLTFAIQGSLRLPPGWWVGSEQGLRDMWVRVRGGLGMGRVCDYLPPTLQTLDLSSTPLGELILEEDCTSPPLQHLEAIRSLLTRISLCTPKLTTLYVNNNEVGGDMEWAGCAGGVSGVMYLHASHNHLTSASSCSWPSLATMQLKGNWLTSLDLTSCPPHNLTSLTASKNYLTDAPSPLPPGLVLLDLSHNNITALPILTHALQKADFSFNSLTSVGENRFKRARKLHHLNLAHNHLTKILDKDFYGLEKLHRLDLSHNKLESIAASSLLPFHHLRHLHLHHNHLTHLDARVRQALSSHTHATLHNNPWECNCQMLAALTQLQACPECKHKRVALQCKERDHLQEVNALLHTCLHAIQHSQGQIVDESDEDISEEQRGNTDEGAAGAVLVVPSLVVLIAVAVSVACGYKLYRKHRRSIITTFTPYCDWCNGCCGSSGMNNNNHNHNHHQEASQLPTGELQDSDTETEM